MGKQGQQSWQKDKGRAWDYWSGSWRSWDAKDKDKNKAGSSNQSANKSQAFPKYQDVMITDVAKDSEVHAHLEGQTETAAGKPEFIKEMQKAINVNRRLDNRSRRLSEERATRVLQWEQYQRQLREAFLAQHQSFNQDIERIDNELSALKEQKEVAKQNLALIAEGKVKDSEHNMVYNALVSTQGRDAWEGLIGIGAGMNVDDSWKDSVTRPPTNNDFQTMLDELKEENGIREELLRAQLRQVQNELRQFKQGHAGEDGAAPTTPTIRTTTGCPLTPQRPLPPVQALTHGNGSTAVCMQDPYLVATGKGLEPFSASPGTTSLQEGFPHVDGLRVESVSPVKAPRSRTGKLATRTL